MLSDSLSSSVSATARTSLEAAVSSALSVEASTVSLASLCEDHVFADELGPRWSTWSGSRRRGTALNTQRSGSYGSQTDPEDEDLHWQRPGPMIGAGFAPRTSGHGPPVNFGNKLSLKHRLQEPPSQLSAAIGRHFLATGDLPPIYINITGGSDLSTCGDASSPCATFRYAVNNIASQLQPLAAVATLVLGPGVFGPANCGAVAMRPVNITGAGPGSTVLDCGGVSQGLVAYSDLSMSGITVTGGFLNVSRVCDGSSFEAGGAGVAVMWSPGQIGASATFVDTVFMNNTVTGVLTKPLGRFCGVIGGAGLFLVGGGNGSIITIRGCSFSGNVENITTTSAFLYDAPATFGGGAGVIVGDPSGVNDTSSLSNVTVEVSNCLAEGNTGGDGKRFPKKNAPWTEAAPGCDRICLVALLVRWRNYRRHLPQEGYRRLPGVRCQHGSKQQCSWYAN